jgi:hypothetical protein
MSISNHINNVLPLLDNPLTLLELAETRCLPSYLHIESVALLMYPESERQQSALKMVLRSEIIHENIKSLTTEKFTKLAKDEREGRESDRYRDPDPFDNTIRIGFSAVAINGTDIIPGDEGKDYDEKRIQVVHRDEIKKWLEKGGDWPVDKDIPLSKWWPEESKIVSEHSMPLIERLPIGDLINALSNDPIYSDNKRALSILRHLMPENEISPIAILGRGTYSFYLILAWTSYCKPSLSLYLPHRSEPVPLDWKDAEKFTDYRRDSGYRFEGTARFVKFRDMEINQEELRQFLLARELCLPVELYPKDPANCQRQFELEQANYQRQFKEEIQFSQCLIYSFFLAS